MKAMHKLAKWKVYALLIAIIATGTAAYNIGTNFLSYPTEKHRTVAQSLNEMAQQSVSDGNPQAVMESDAFTSLEATTENVYSTRMGIGSGVLSIILNVAVIVAVYRYVRRHSVTRRPVGATVLVTLTASTLAAMVSIVYSNWLVPFNMEEAMLLTMLAALPFAVVISGLFSFLVAKLAEWHYNRSHGFIEE